MKLATVTCIVAAATGLSGCSFSIGSSDQKTELEKIIRVQLPDQAKEAGLGEVTVKSVDCVDKGESRYDCLAEIAGTTKDGKPATRSISIEGSCDDAECVWKSK